MKLGIAGGLIILLSLTAFAPASDASNPLNTTRWAEKGVNLGVRNELTRRLGKSTYLRMMRSDCRRTASARFRCTFKAGVADGYWIGAGTVRFLRGGIFPYSLRGRIEECGVYDCVKTGTFRWKGRAAPFG